MRFNVIVIVLVEQDFVLENYNNNNIRRVECLENY